MYFGPDETYSVTFVSGSTLEPDDGFVLITFPSATVSEYSYSTTGRRPLFVIESFADDSSTLERSGILILFETGACVEDGVRLVSLVGSGVTFDRKPQEDKSKTTSVSAKAMIFFIGILRWVKFIATVLYRNLVVLSRFKGNFTNDRVN